MVSTSLPAQPHHLEFATAIAEDVRRHLDRLGRMRGLAVVRVGANGFYRVQIVPAADVRTSFLAEFGVGLLEAIDLIDGIADYDPQTQAALLVAEANPVDGLLVSFLTLEWGLPPLESAGGVL